MFVNSLVTSEKRIPFGRALQYIPKQYLKDVLNFTSYLSDTSDKTFIIRGHVSSTGEPVVKEIPYVHRWTPVYRRSILAKLYQLEDSLGNDLYDVTMITLTTYQRDLSPEDCLFMLKEFFNRLFKCLRKSVGTVDYFAILEHHETGYPHMHIMYMKCLNEAEKEHIRLLWSSLYGVGSYQHGVEFSEPQKSENGYFKSGSVGRVRGYLMKYVSKGLRDEKECSDLSLNMSLGELLLNSLLKKHNIKRWTCSRYFSKIMARVVPEKKDYVCDTVEEYKAGDFLKVRWNKESGLDPLTVKTMVKLEGLSVPFVCRCDLSECEKYVYNEVTKLYDRYKIVWVPNGVVNGV